MSLLQRAQRADDDAWERLCDLYGPLVYNWCRSAGLREHDAGDAVQEVFRSVHRKINDFRADDAGSTFRGWLWTITRNQVALFFRRQRREPVAFGGSDAQMQFANHPEELADATVNEQDHRTEILQRALELIRGDFNAATWQAFEQFTLEERSAKEVAENLGTTENSVRQAKYRVLCRLKVELDGQI